MGGASWRPPPTSPPGAWFPPWMETSFTPPLLEFLGPCCSLSKATCLHARPGQVQGRAGGARVPSPSAQAVGRKDSTRGHGDARPRDVPRAGIRTGEASGEGGSEHAGSRERQLPGSDLGTKGRGLQASPQPRHPGWSSCRARGSAFQGCCRVKPPRWAGKPTGSLGAPPGPCRLCRWGLRAGATYARLFGTFLPPGLQSSCREDHHL